MRVAIGPTGARRAASRRQGGLSRFAGRAMSNDPGEDSLLGLAPQKLWGEELQRTVRPVAFSARDLYRMPGAEFPDYL